MLGRMGPAPRPSQRRRSPGAGGMAYTDAQRRVINRYRSLGYFILSTFADGLGRVEIVILNEWTNTKGRVLIALDGTRLHPDTKERLY